MNSLIYFYLLLQLPFNQNQQELYLVGSYSCVHYQNDSIRILGMSNYGFQDLKNYFDFGYCNKIISKDDSCYFTVNYISSHRSSIRVLSDEVIYAQGLISKASQADKSILFKGKIYDRTLMRNGEIEVTEYENETWDYTYAKNIANDYIMYIVNDYEYIEIYKTSPPLKKDLARMPELANEVKNYFENKFYKNKRITFFCKQ